MKKIYLYFKEGVYCNANGDPITSSQDVFMNEILLVCCTFMNADKAGIDLSSGTFEFAADKDRKHTGGLMLYASGLTEVSGFSDPANGKIAFTVSANNSGFTEKLGVADALDMIAQITHLYSGGQSTLAMFKIKAQNVVHLTQNEPESGAVGYYTAAQTDALFSAGLVLQFSADESSWHDTFTVNDVFYRIRLATGNGPWSPSIPIPQATITAQNFEYAFDTALGAGDSVTFSKETLLLTNEPDVSLWQVLTNGNRIKIQSGIASFTWGTDGLTIGYYQGFPEGSWIIKG